MKEVTGNLWLHPADIRVILTNGTINRYGEAVMGIGCALEAKQRHPALPRELGTLIHERGNIVHDLGKWGGEGARLVSFPTKHQWCQGADIKLIEQSCQYLVAHAGMFSHTVRYVIPRPGCGAGGLKWDDVKPVLERYFDERFHVISFKP